MEVDDDQRLPRARPQAPDRAAIPGRERGDRRVAGAQGADELRALAVDRGGRAAQEDRERRRVAEVLAQDARWRARRACRGCRARSGSGGCRRRCRGRRGARRTRAATASTTRGCRSKHTRSLPEDTVVVWRSGSRREPRSGEGLVKARAPAQGRYFSPSKVFEWTWAAGVRSTAQSLLARLRGPARALRRAAPTRR